jgi:hypothetical protein
MQLLQQKRKRKRSKMKRSRSKKRKSSRVAVTKSLVVNPKSSQVPAACQVQEAG